MDRLSSYKNRRVPDHSTTIKLFFQPALQTMRRGIVARLRIYSATAALNCAIALFPWLTGSAQSIRSDISLNNNWLSIASSNDKLLDTGLYKVNADDRKWIAVNVPHNWDAYEGYRRLRHGNRHGDAWYRKAFSIKQSKANKRFFLFFEGVGSYAFVYVNGQYAGQHAGGRTSFTIDVTDLIKTNGSNNLLAVRAWHPSNIRDLPWVCGGCSDERGFSEGSQPMGIFRPVHLVVTNDTRIEPFGVHAWSDLQDAATLLHVNTTVRNYSPFRRNITIKQQIKDAAGKIVQEASVQQVLKANDSITAVQNISVDKPTRWSLQTPYCYTLVTVLQENRRPIDQTVMAIGFRTINWRTGSHQFLLNGQPVFINGIAEYEHLLGQSHAFAHEQIETRIKWVKAAGFNAFRDAHQPHNLLYGQLCDKEGILWWPQLSAHIWYDSPAFRQNFKQLLKEWVIERRNEPSLILWGLQNESKLPEDFAKECTALIRELDPTAAAERLVTTCNGGAGTDWDVPQNWTGTYGGNPDTYAADLKKQVLVGEYGAWRTLDLHTEGPYQENGLLSEDRMVQLMEKKIQLANAVKDSCAGQFFWLLSSHDNPGRVQGGEGERELDRIGPVNYKGMLTPWEEPTDVFYMFRSNYAVKTVSPMVYIVSHTWPGRWRVPGIKDSIVVYSNCDEVELFNDIGGSSLGKRKKCGTGTHFQWDSVHIQYNILYAEGFTNGKIVARDTIRLNHLPVAPHYKNLYRAAVSITKPARGYHYIYRFNCGGPEYTDENKNLWMADRSLANGSPLNAHTAGSSSWTRDFAGMPAYFGSQRRTFSPVSNTHDQELFQTFRYGRDKLQFEFPVPDGEYMLELYFIEPWLGLGGGMNATGMRMFDVAINDKIVLKNLDVWKEAGTNTVIKKMVHASVRGGRLVISFPHCRSGQAIISAIAIASKKKLAVTATTEELVTELTGAAKAASWLDIGNKQYSDKEIEFRALPAAFFGADWLQFPGKATNAPVSFTIAADADVFVGIPAGTAMPQALKDFEFTDTDIETDENGGKKYAVYRKRFSKHAVITLQTPGKNNSMFPVVIVPANNMQPAYDLKPVVSYRSNTALPGTGAQQGMINGKDAVIIKTNDAVSVEWPVLIGAADIYAISVKYYNPLEKGLNATVQLAGAGGTMMPEEPLGFSFTRAGKWNSVQFNTHTMINAGNYTIKLIFNNAAGLALSGIDIQ
jgi:beta-galactosidase